MAQRMAISAIMIRNGLRENKESDMEEEVISSPEIKPYQGSTLPDTPSPLVGKVQEIRESLPKDPDERLLFLRNHPNPYLRLYADQKEK